MERARARGFEWILHLDVDELFFAGGFSRTAEGPGALPLSIHHHFSELEKGGFTSAVYLNYEAVPIKAESDFFTETTLFKRNRCVLGHLAGARRAMEQWAQGTPSSEPHMTWEQGYWTGKSAARVRPLSHTSKPGINATRKDGSKVTVSPPVAIEVTRWYVGDKGQDRRADFDGPLVLHYINPTLSSVMDKYRLLGRFSDHSWNRNLATTKVFPVAVPM